MNIETLGTPSPGEERPEPDSASRRPPGAGGCEERALREALERGRRELAESELRFRELAENIREVFWIVDARSGRLDYVSPAFEEVYGRSRESLLADRMSFLETVHPQDRERVRRALENLTEGHYDVEYRILRPNREMGRIHSRAFPVRDAQGRVIRVVGIAEDVTESRRVAEAHRFLVEASTVFSASLDYDETLRTIARLTVPEMADWCAVDVMEEQELRRVAVAHWDPAKESLARQFAGDFPATPLTAPTMVRVMQTGEPELIPEVTDQVLQGFAADQAQLPLLRSLGMLSAMVVPMVSRERVLGTLSFGTAESGRRYVPKDLELALEMAGLAALAIENALHYRQMQEARGEAERRAREETALREAASALATAITTEEVVSRIAESALTATESDVALVERVNAAADDVEIVAIAGEGSIPVGGRLAYAGSLAETVLRRREPVYIPSLTEAAGWVSPDLIRAFPRNSGLALPFVDAGEAFGTLVLLRGPEKQAFRPGEAERAKTFADLAALAFRKASILEESERRRAELEVVTESRAYLMRGFSHDVKNPLTAADGYLHLLVKGRYDPLTPAQAATVARIRRTMQRAFGLIDELLELARAESGQIAINGAPTDVGEAAREVVEEFRAKAEAEGLSLTVVTEGDCPVIVSDVARVRQILGNLLSNAIQYTRTGRVVTTVERRSGGQAPGPGPWLVVDVCDTGPGIRTDQMPLLFQEFRRLQTAEGKKGAGIGLATSRRIARALGGDLTVESAEGEGSTFTLWLPLKLPVNQGSQTSAA